MKLHIDWAPLCRSIGLAVLLTNLAACASKEPPTPETAGATPARPDSDAGKPAAPGRVDSGGEVREPGGGMPRPPSAPGSENDGAAPGGDAGTAPRDPTGTDARATADVGPPGAGPAAGDADGGPAPPAGELHLESTGFIEVGADLIFPKSASYPADQSPPFTFVGVPAAAKSLALTFVDHSIGAVKWVVWDIPPQAPGLPANLSKTPHPAELPTSTQRGSLGRTGYSGPGVKGPPLHTYEFQLYALDVAVLPGTEGADTVAIRAKALAAHTLAKSPLYVAKGQLGGP